jgi:hypothetical protein
MDDLRYSFWLLAAKHGCCDICLLSACHMGTKMTTLHELLNDLEEKSNDPRVKGFTWFSCAEVKKLIAALRVAAEAITGMECEYNEVRLNGVLITKVHEQWCRRCKALSQIREIFEVRE